MCIRCKTSDSKAYTNLDFEGPTSRDKPIASSGQSGLSDCSPVIIRQSTIQAVLQGLGYCGHAQRGQLRRHRDLVDFSCVRHCRRLVVVPALVQQPDQRAVEAVRIVYNGAHRNDVAKGGVLAKGRRALAGHVAQGGRAERGDCNCVCVKLVVWLPVEAHRLACGVTHTRGGSSWSLASLSGRQTSFERPDGGLPLVKADTRNVERFHLKQGPEAPASLQDGGDLRRGVLLGCGKGLYGAATSPCRKAADLLALRSKKCRSSACLACPQAQMAQRRAVYAQMQPHLLRLV